MLLPFDDRFEHRLAGRVAQGEPRSLQLAVVQPAAEAQLGEHLVGDRDAQAAELAGGELRPPRGQDRQRRLAEQA